LKSEIDGRNRDPFDQIRREKGKRGERGENEGEDSKGLCNPKAEGIRNLKKNFDPLTRHHDHGGKNTRKSASQANLEEIERLIRRGSLKILANAISKEADGVHGSHSKKRGCHSLVKSKEPFPLDCLCGAVNNPLCWFHVMLYSSSSSLQCFFFFFFLFFFYGSTSFFLSFLPVNSLSFLVCWFISFCSPLSLIGSEVSCHLFNSMKNQQKDRRKEGRKERRRKTLYWVEVCSLTLMVSRGWPEATRHTPPNPPATKSYLYRSFSSFLSFSLLLFFFR